MAIAMGRMVVPVAMMTTTATTAQRSSSAICATFAFGTWVRVGCGGALFARGRCVILAGAFIYPNVVVGHPSGRAFELPPRYLELRTSSPLMSQPGPPTVQASPAAFSAGGPTRGLSTAAWRRFSIAICICVQAPNFDPSSLRTSPPSHRNSSSRRCHCRGMWLLSLRRGLNALWAWELAKKVVEEKVYKG